MTSILKTEKPFTNPEFQEARTLMFTVLASKTPNTPQNPLVMPHDDTLPEVDRVQRILR